MPCERVIETVWIDPKAPVSGREPAERRQLMRTFVTAIVTISTVVLAGVVADRALAASICVGSHKAATR